MAVKLTMAEIKAWARKHYNDGADVIVECWEDKEIEEFIRDDGTLATLKTLCGIWREKESIAEYEGRY